MALTNATSQKITDHSQAPGRMTQEAAILMDKAIVARPLSAPEVASIHVKNTEYYYRWVNRLHSNGRVYMERKAMGFTNATTEDVEVLVGDTVSNESEIRCGDVILMKIPFREWAGHVKRSMETAQVLQRMRGVHTKEEDLSGDIFAEGGKASHTSVASDLNNSKVRPFIPENPDAYLDGQKAEDVARAKETVADIRKSIGKVTKV
jgi:hypothetical protein